MKNLFRSLYQKLLEWSAHRRAVYILALVSGAEAVFFPIPPDPMLVTMSLAQSKRALWFAFVTSVSSVLGAGIGYLLGLTLYTQLEPSIVYFGYAQSMLLVHDWFRDWGFWAIVFAGFTPIPFKLFTISAGAAQMNFLSFLIGACIGRFSRFYLVGIALYFGGDRLNRILLKSISLLGWVILACVLLYGYWIVWM